LVLVLPLALALWAAAGANFGGFPADAWAANVMSASKAAPVVTDLQDSMTSSSPRKVARACLPLSKQVVRSPSHGSAAKAMAG
jgi:hypothetical protein